MVYEIKAGVVTQIWQDCDTLDQWANKYGDGTVAPNLFKGDAVPGQVIGAKGALENPPAPAPTAAEIRQERAELLAESDWTQLSDTPLTVAQKTTWAAYRQALRDVTKQLGFPTHVSWPPIPSGFK